MKGELKKMTTNIFEITINLHNLSETLDIFRATTNMIPYLFMNSKTLHFLSDTCIKGLSLFEFEEDDERMYKSGVLATYQGYKIYEDPDLEDGIVEVR